MDILLGVGATWVAAAAVITFGLCRAAAEPRPFQIEKPRPLHLVG